MKWNIKTIAITLVGALIIAFILTLRGCTKEKSGNRRLERTLEAATKDAEYYKLEDSTSCARVSAMELKKNEFEKLCASQADELASLKIKMKNVLSYSESASRNVVTLRDTIRDSIIMVENYLDTIKCVEYHDAYTDFSGCIGKDSVFTGSMESRDTLEQVVHLTYDHYFLWFGYGKKRIKQTIRSKNPHNTITYQKYIEIDK